MALKKVSKKMNEIEDDNTSIFQDGDYFTAHVKNGRETVKIRGIVYETGFGYALYNNQFGEEVDCDEGDGYSFMIYLDGDTQRDLDDAEVLPELYF